MSSNSEPTPDKNLDKTFRTYTSTQASSYAKHRSQQYSSKLYALILSHHQETGGQLDTLLDVGCGTGGVTRGLSPFFQYAVGADAGEAMIEQAKNLGGETGSGKEVRFEVRGAEELEKLESVKEGEVDLLVAAMAAHWFRMDEFWPAAARMVKIGGTVALWTQSSFFCHPSTPNAAKVQEALSELEDGFLRPYELPSIKLTRNMYDDLIMPWDLDPSVTAFPQSSSSQFEWNRNGVIERDEEDFFSESKEMTLKELGDGLGTASMVTQWRKANSEAIEMGKDCVDVTMKKISIAMTGKDGDYDQIRLKTGSATALLLFKREK